MRRIATLLAAVGLLAFAAQVQAAPPGTFDKMFPKLDPLVVTDTQSRDIAVSMTEGPAKNQPDNNTSFVVGQFIDHDVTNDPAPADRNDGTPPTPSQDNVRTATLDLDSVYGDGPQGTPVLYQADGLHFKIGTNPAGFRDLPRTSDGLAILADGRNDENLVIAQLHLAFLLRHNQLIDSGLSFEQARLALTRQWQYLVLNEYLDRFVGPVARIPEFKPGNKKDPVMPIEFSQACFRHGHSQVRNAYNLNTNGVNRRAFQLAPLNDLLADNPATLLGGRPIPANARIEWNRFFDIPGEPLAAGVTPNNGRLIDTDISLSMQSLPIPSVISGGGDGLISFRNLERGSNNGLASYEDVARALGITPVDVRATIADYPAFVPAETPLWFGMLAESEALGGQKLGPTCGRIVNEVLRTNTERDKDSYLHVDGYVPPAQTMGEFLKLAGVTGGPF